LSVSGPTADFNMVSAATGVGRTYRYADRIPPEFVNLQFGFGLSYSRFLYAGLSAERRAGDGAVIVNFTVANVGAFPVAREVVQLYVRVPRVAGLATPTLNLRAFAVLELDTAEPPTAVSFTLPWPDAFTTTAADGSTAVSGGQYALFVSGHQPDDALGAAQSNVVTTAITLPAQPGRPAPGSGMAAAAAARRG